MARRSSFRGVSRLRRKLRRCPDETTEEVRHGVAETVQELNFEALRRVPVDEGDLAQALHMRVARDGLTGEVGYTKKQKRKWDLAGWRAHFTEFGTFGGVVQSGPRKGARIPQQQGVGFLTKASATVLPRAALRIKSAMDRAIKQLARGAPSRVQRNV